MDPHTHFGLHNRIHKYRYGFLVQYLAHKNPVSYVISTSQGIISAHTKGGTRCLNSDNLIGKILHECLPFPEDLLHALSQVIVHDLAEADMVGGQVLPRNSLQQRVG